MNILIILAVVFYFIPTIIAHNRKNFGSILVVNLLLGWTLIGWAAALAWAFSSEKDGITYTCPHCGYKHQLDQQVKIHVCPQCGFQSAYEV